MLCWLAPGTSEVIAMLGFPDNPVGPPLDELCAYARQTLEGIREHHRGLPDDETRALEKGIEETCR